MKLSHLKNIIKESIKELQNKKTLLTEGCEAREIYGGWHPCLCQTSDPNVTYNCNGFLSIVQNTNCSITTYHQCTCCDSKTGAPMGPTMPG